MPTKVTVTVNGSPVTVEEGTSVAAALLNQDQFKFRTSVNGQPRGPVCGMGICYECRVIINGGAHQRACMIACEPGMDVREDA